MITSRLSVKVVGFVPLPVKEKARCVLFLVPEIYDSELMKTANTLSAGEQ